MPTCAVRHCSNKLKDGVRMFRWPSAPDRSRTWLESFVDMDAAGWRPNSYSRVCERHFDSSQFEQHRQDGWRKLKPNAVPTLFLTKNHSDGKDRSKSESRNIDNESQPHQDLQVTDCEDHDLHSQVVAAVPAEVLLDVTAPEESARQNITLDLQVYEVTSKPTDQNSAAREHSYSNMLKIYQCPVCGRMQSSVRSLIDHITSHKKLKTLKLKSVTHQLHPCCICHKEFSRNSVLASHIRIVHSDEMTSATVLKNSKSQSGKRRHLCATCGRLFANIATFQRHCERHAVARDRRYLCSACGKRLATGAALRQHAAVHDCRLLACAHCSRCFSRAGDLRKHVQTHTDDRLYVCSVCGCSFARSYTLLLHRQTHVGTRTAYCTRCCRSFSSDAALKVHHRRCESW